ncbi:MAG: undecaprenyldiphospho-muramoylpentapeptide beta-N-acetylglucosaminyltransferase [Streptococcaceae bacterium]|nr:undecaprenyldiphospho-muramoylpentapeptide beta-N-acetylglucosaminyltransferase [Streptococcaceae bacterium]
MRIILTGGGTGGHIYPALAFAKYMKSNIPGTEILYIGGERGLEGKLVPEAGLPFESIELQGFKRSLSPSNIKTVALFLKSLKRAKTLIQTFQPDVVIGTGGYVSGSVMYQASKMGIPTIVHEQNSVPGMTNKFLSKHATAIATSFKQVSAYFPKAKKVVYTGNPRAEEVASIEKSDILTEFGLNTNKPTAVIFGGSQGALKINQALVEALPKFNGKPYQILYASGERYYKEFESVFENAAKEMDNISILPYISRMPEVLANASLMVGRSGATSIAEITALGLPAIFIPSPYVTNDHQTKNAKALVDTGAAKLILDEELNGETLVQAIDSVFCEPSVLKEMSEASTGLGVKDANQRLYKLAKEIIGEKHE